MRKMLWVMLILGICLPALASAAVLFEENFDYTPGTLLTANGWTNHSGTANFIPVTTGGLSYAGYPSGIGNAASMLNTGEDVNRAFALQTSGSIYYAFLVNVTAAGNADYFTHLGTSPWSTTFMGRVFCRTTTGGVNFGVTRSGAAALAVWAPTVYATGATHLIVVKYTFVDGAANDLVSFWVDPTSCPDEPAPLGTAIETTADPSGIGGVGLRQGSTGPTQWIDGLRIGTSWSEVVCGAAFGACCFPNGSCLVLDAAACAAQGGTYAGDGTNCTPNNCPQPTGSCCLPDGACSVTTQAACGGVWTDGGACVPNPCPQPGSCCLPTGACSVTYEPDCTAGIWTLGGVCAPNTCAQPTGSCCAQSGDCTVTEELACVGIWTLGGVCEPNPCVQPTGACCFPTGDCSVTFQVTCVAQGGVYMGDGAACEPNPCPQPTGSCCAPDGTCTVTQVAACYETWTMFGVCEPNPCVQPTGACCALDGTCTLTLLVDCPPPGVWNMFILCPVLRDNPYEGPCVQPEGSCCLPDGSCTVTLNADCTGTWTAFGVCDPNTCLQPTGACCLPSSLCVLGTVADCAAVGGAYQGNGTTCAPNPCPAPVKTLCEVAEDDMNGVAVLVGQRVTVEGIALCDGLTWSTTIREFQITDGNCCIDVFGGTMLPAVALGDLVRVTGTVANYNGKTEITTPDMTVTVLSSGNPIPAPGVTTTGALAASGEPFESCLFTIQCVSIVGGDPWPASGVNANIIIDDGSGPVTMRIDKDTNIDGSPAPVGPFTITGIGDQFDSTSPYTTGYQIKPRSLADFVYDCATGACCFADGHCAVSDGDGCASQGGVYSGDGTTCDPNNCPPPVGACCFPTGVCEILPASACQGGLWLGFGSVCVPDNPCEQPTGSCCYPDGTCIVMPQGPCDGVWTMFGVCEPNTCEPPPPPSGSCCYLDGTCAVTIQLDCTAIWLLDGVCDPNTCPPPPVLGACCDHETGNCTVTVQTACQFDWLGAGVPCDVTTCLPPTPTERTSWGQIKNLYR